eukprot:TRINITY_DN8153_c0_g1_i1.p1 TRINITY_DN8153_c0_g1~~TRINITY_DN8153_c0_g1_i1.p1  ORF type:complete len:532 (+),score=110.27 TRINITY_DN8153_c0_g1_i1:508-2103(+)
MFNQFVLGVDGQCSRYDPPESYWCSNSSAGGGAFPYRVPSGLTYDGGMLPHAPYKQADGAVVFAWRPGHWANWMFEVDQYNAATETIAWTKGGFQGARGNDQGAEWFIENVFEELDNPNEFFYNAADSTLYYYHNGTGAPLDMEFVAMQVKQLITVVGMQEQPVRDVTIQGLVFTAAAMTYMDAHGVPSGGDWALDRFGAVFLQGTEGTVVDNCLFTRLDGNALFLSGYNRNTTFSNNEFSWLGQNAMAAWGFTEDIDGTNGEQPRFTTIVGNLIHELGHFEKQSSCWFQAKSCQTTLLNNICFNIPRAGFNINDGFGGANEVNENLLFNSCRESGDHGPFNSWDRQPFLTTVGDGHKRSLVPAYNEIQNNFMVANYGADGGCIDNDDGSSYYNIHDNFFVFGGHKSDFGGHNKRDYNNMEAYANVYGHHCFSGVTGIAAEFAEGYWNNTCILADLGDNYMNIEGCSTKADQYFMITHSNRVYVPMASSNVMCERLYQFAEWVGLGLDNSTIHDAPDAAQIMDWAKAVLHM